MNTFMVIFINKGVHQLPPYTWPSNDCVCVMIRTVYIGEMLLLTLIKGSGCMSVHGI